jgi:phage gp37-like protein
MSGLSVATVEDAVLAALQARLGEAVKTLKTYQGSWREDLQREGWRLPAVLVIFEASRAEQVGLSSYDLTLSLSILVIVRRLRGEVAGRRGKGGVYEMLAGVRQALWHRDLGLNMLPLALVKEEALPGLREYAVHAAHYRTGLVQDF